MKHFLRGLALITAFFIPAISFAQGIIDNTLPCNWTNGLWDPGSGKFQPECAPLLIAHIIEFVFTVIGTVFLLNIMYAGFQIATGSVTGQKEDGKNRIRWAIIGFICSVAAYLILDLVGRVFLA